MSIGGLTNYNLGNIQSLAGGKSTNATAAPGATSTGGSFDLGNAGAGDESGIAQTNTGLGNVSPNDGAANSALNSVAGESSIQQQFQNQLALVNLQERIQNQSRTIEILTNILKARHDASLSAARNVKS